MKTVEELFEIIVNSPISPKPSCDSLSFIWNWRDHIESSLTQRKLKNHSFYNAFKICREDSHVKLKVKRLPQDLEWLPPTGIRLLKPNSGNEPVGCADFWVEDLMLSRILANLEKLHEVCKFNLESQDVALPEVHQGPGEAAGGD